MFTTNHKPRPIVYLRYTHERDIPGIFFIETESFEFPWDKNDFMRHMQRPYSGMLAEINKQIVGYMFYEFVGPRMHLLNFAVHPDWRRQSVGTQMTGRLIAKLSTEKIHQRIVVKVRETNLSAQKFFSRCGFKGLNVLRGYYRDSSEDAFLMQYKYKTPDLLTNIINSVQDLTTKPQ